MPFEIVYRSGSTQGVRSAVLPETFPTREEARDALYRAYPGADAAWPKLNIRECEPSPDSPS